MFDRRERKGEQHEHIRMMTYVFSYNDNYQKIIDHNRFAFIQRTGFFLFCLNVLCTVRACKRYVGVH
jgi:hypothetical protein